MRVNNLEWSNELLDGGAKKTQMEWNKWCKDKEWRLPTLDEFSELFEKWKDGDFKEKTEKVFLEEHGLMTADKKFSPHANKENPLMVGAYYADYKYKNVFLIVRNYGCALGVKNVEEPKEESIKDEKKFEEEQKR